MGQEAQQLLEQMQPVHLPQSIDWWPIATAWYVLLFSILFICALSVFFWVKRKRNNVFRKEAVQKLYSIQSAFENQQCSKLETLQAVSLLLKRLALTFDSRERISALSGNPWLEYLDRIDQSHFFTAQQGKLLGDTLYQNNEQAIDDEDLQTLLAHCEQLLKTFKAKRNGNLSHA